MSAATRLAEVPSSVLEDLRARYAEPQRAYHSWAHVEALLHWFDQVEDRLARPAAVLHAILFHDAIYDPMLQDNEMASARLLAEADLPALSDADRAEAVALIEATLGHRLPENADPDGDAGLFLDMDLSIFGAPPAVFDRYEDDVRFEYGFVPEPIFRAGRRRILEGFVAREQLYFSAWGVETFEAQARENLARSISRLEQAPA